MLGCTETFEGGYSRTSFRGSARVAAGIPQVIYIVGLRWAKLREKPRREADEIGK